MAKVKQVKVIAVDNKDRKFGVSEGHAVEYFRGKR